MSVLPPGLVLPYYARTDLAWEDTRFGPGRVLGSAFTYRTLAGSIDVITGVALQIQTSVTAGNRDIRLAWIDDANRTVSTATPGVTQPPARTIFYSFAPETSSYSGMIGDDVVAPLQYVVMRPGWEFDVICQNADALDVAQSTLLTLIHIPTGPPVSYDLPTERRRLTPAI